MVKKKFKWKPKYNNGTIIQSQIINIYNGMTNDESAVQNNDKCTLKYIINVCEEYCLYRTRLCHPNHPHSPETKVTEESLTEC